MSIRSCFYAAVLILSFLLITETGVLAAVSAGSSDPGGKLEISFLFERDDAASSQYAVWVEDLAGKLVKTLYVTDFTTSGGFRRRSEGLPTWVSKADRSELSQNLVEALAASTPKSGEKRYVWDGKDQSGKSVEAGEYRFCVESSCRWSERSFFYGNLRVDSAATAEIPVTARYTPDGESRPGL